jgi:hypothetical protein
MNQLGVALAASLVTVAASAQDQTIDATTYFPQQLSARELMVHCAASSLTERGRQRQRYCAGFVSGVEEAARLLLGTSPTTPIRFCISAKATAREFREAYIQYGGRRGTDLERPAALVVIETLVDAYPCKP